LSASPIIKTILLICNNGEAMSYFFEGSGYFDSSYVVNSTVGSSSVVSSSIKESSIDMLSSLGAYQNITNVADPIQQQDAATKKYVDALGIIRGQITLTGTQSSLLVNVLKGSYVITISNDIYNGPSGIFHVTKSEANQTAHVVRTASAPGYSSSVHLQLDWPINDGLYLNKTGASYNGSYSFKLM
jgi:hypothetical protein